MNILIAGGTGLIGKPLTEQLLLAGHTVTLLSRKPARAQVPGGARAVGWDARTTEGWSGLMEETDAVVNLAGENLSEGRWTPERLRRIRESRVQSGAALTEAIQQASKRPRVLVQASAVGFYGPMDDRRLDETSPAGSDPLARICLEWEASTRAVEALGVRRVVVRTGIVLSTHGGALPLMLLPFRLFAGGPLGNGKQYLSWIALEDEVRALQFLIENESAEGVYNLTAPSPMTNAEFGKVIANVMKRPYWLPAPAFAIRLALGKMSTLAVDGQRVQPERLMAMGFKFQYPELRPALEKLLNPLV